MSHEAGFFRAGQCSRFATLSGGGVLCRDERTRAASSSRRRAVWAEHTYHARPAIALAGHILAAAESRRWSFVASAVVLVESSRERDPHRVGSVFDVGRVGQLGVPRGGVAVVPEGDSVRLVAASTSESAAAGDRHLRRPRAASGRAEGDPSAAHHFTTSGCVGGTDILTAPITDSNRVPARLRQRPK